MWSLFKALGFAVKQFRDDTNDSEQAILNVFKNASDEMTSYEIARALERRLGHLVGLGTIYLAISRLERAGKLASRWGDYTPPSGVTRPRKWYFLPETATVDTADQIV